MTENINVNKKLVIIIVNFRTPELVVDCLKTLEKEKSQTPIFTVSVIDNNSGDHSIELLNKAITSNLWGDWVDLSSSPINGGFSYGNNIAIRKIIHSDNPSEYIYLLNPDVLVHSGCIKSLVNFMDENQNVGITGGAIVDMDGIPQTAARRFPTLLSELEAAARLGLLSKLLHKHNISMEIQTSAHSCDWVSGASMMIRRNVIDTIGLMDEEYFLYFEELDFCFRAKKAGFDICYLPEAVISHIEGASTKVNKKQRRGGYWYNSRRRYIVKTQGVLSLVLNDILWGLGRLSFNIRRILHLGNDFSSAQKDPTMFAWDLLLGDFKALFSRKIWQIASKSKIE